VWLRVRMAGDGAPEVPLHGHPQRGVCLHRVAPRLAERYGVVPDLRGHRGSSTPPDNADHTLQSRRTTTTDVVALMTSLDHARFSLVGHDRASGGVAADARRSDTLVRLCTLDVFATIEQFELQSAHRRAALTGLH
jgi:haloacetate dehalogenase